MRGQRVFDEMTKFSPTRGVAIILAVCMVGWGTALLLPGSTFGTAAAFAAMKALASEGLWGGAMAFGGLTLTVGVWKRNPEWIRLGSFIGFMLWALVAVLSGFSLHALTAVVLRVTLAALHAWVYLQSKIHPELITGEITIDDLRQYVGTKKGASQTPNT